MDKFWAALLSPFQTNDNSNNSSNSSCGCNSNVNDNNKESYRVRRVVPKRDSGNDYNDQVVESMTNDKVMGHLCPKRIVPPQDFRRHAHANMRMGSNMPEFDEERFYTYGANDTHHDRWTYQMMQQKSRANCIKS